MVGENAFPPRFGIDLLEFDLVRGDWLSFPVEDEEARARRSLVNGTNVDILGRHAVLPSVALIGVTVRRVGDGWLPRSRLLRGGG